MLCQVYSQVNQLYIYIEQQCSESRSVIPNSLQPHGLQPARLLYPGNSPGKNTRVRCHSLLQRIFPTQGSNLGLLHCRQTLYHLSHQVSNYIYIYIISTLFKILFPQSSLQSTEESSLCQLQLLISYLFYTQQCEGILYNDNHPIYKGSTFMTQ